MFSGGIKRDQWLEMGQVNNPLTDRLHNLIY